MKGSAWASVIVNVRPLVESLGGLQGSGINEVGRIVNQ